MQERQKAAIAIGFTLVAVVLAYEAGTRVNPNRNHVPGDVIDSLDGVAIYFNGGVNHSSGRNLAPDGYNLGIKYQCVEFVKRYYYEHFTHRMPDPYGHAADFFDPGLADGTLNKRRGLVQYANGSAMRPERGDIVIFDRWLLNPYGHVAIVSASGNSVVEIAQQNPGPFGLSRVELPLTFENGRWHIAAPRTLGWLRLPHGAATGSVAPDRPGP